MKVTIGAFTLPGFNLSPGIVDVYLRVYALNSFIRQSNATIVQPGAPAESPFYDEWRCTRENGSLHLPEIALESTIDALAPAHPESLRYYAGFFDPGGNMLCAFWPRPIFALDTNPNPTTWAHVVAYNSPGVEFDWTTTHAEHYSKEEFDALLQNPPQSFAGITVLPPLYFDGTTLWIPRASATQDGYLAAEDFIAFSMGAGMGVISFNTRQGAVVLIDTDVLAALGYTPLNRSGDTMTGPLILAGNPSTGNPMEAATRAYVDAVAGGGGDVTPPAITSGPSTAGVTSTGVTINWATNDSSDSQVQYSIDPDVSYSSHSPITNTPVSSAGVTNHSVTLTGGLTPGTLYHYRVRSADAAGNPVLSAGGTFTTTGGADTTPPVISAVNSSSLTNTVTWTTNEAADSQVEYSTDTSYSSSTSVTDTSPRVTSHSVPLTGLTAGTLYHYRVQSKDAAGNPATPVTGTFTTTSVDLLTGLIGYWKLDETTGARLDSSGGSNSLTPSAPFATVAGKFGLCPHFNDGASHIDAANATFAQMGASVDYTIAFWVQVESSAADHILVNKGGGVGGGADEYLIYYMHPGTPGTARFAYSVQSSTTSSLYTVYADDLGEPALNTWYYIVVWHKVSDETIHIQVNGGADNSFTLVEPPGLRNIPLILGIYGDGTSSPHYGLIDELAIWRNRALGPTERAALYGGGAGRPFDTW